MTTVSTRTLLQVLCAGDAVRLEELLSTEGHVVSIDLNGRTGASPVAVTSPPPSGTSRSSRCLLDVTSNGNTALHIVASRGDAELVRVVCEMAPSLVATRNRSLDTPLHCAAKSGHRDVVARLLPKMLAGGEDEKVALQARNCLGATALYEAVRHRCLEVVELLMREAPELSVLTTEDGVSPLYLAATINSLRMVRAILRPSSPAAYSGPEGRTALHAAADANRGVAREMAQEILRWRPNLLAKVDSFGRNPLHIAILCQSLDVIDLFLDASTSDDELARISDNSGVFPVHFAARVGSTAIVHRLAEKCPDYCEMVDGEGRNLLHYAVEYQQDMVVRHICQNGTFSGLLNAMDCDGNTPLHLAVRLGFPRIVCLLLQTMGVEIDVVNMRGLTARDCARELLPRSSTYEWTPNILVERTLFWSRAAITPSRHRRGRGEQSKRGRNGPADHPVHGDMVEAEQTSEQESFSKTGTIGSVLIATVAFAAAFTVPGGIVADDHPGAGTATMGRRFAFRAFVASNALAFFCSIVSTFFLLYSGTRGAGASPSQREWYNSRALNLLALSALFTMAAFSFGFQLVLGDANRGFSVFVYRLSSVSVLFCIPAIWFPLRIGLLKALALGDANRWFIVFVYAAPAASVLFCIPDIWVPLRIGLLKVTWLLSDELTIDVSGYESPQYARSSENLSILYSQYTQSLGMA
ncbi:hypothetical protein U9M48_015423 [Paspalum notatum var. saurae]|uniref:PGG domain-containing protein n=1 Tax=Paspalum notatum var. saurae TaxID=547442 RepID=A0AAQ3T4T7_PASNO